MDREDLQTIITIAKQDKHQKLDLSNRDIDEIPTEIGELTDLQELNLSYNNIKSLPESISGLKQLNSLLLMRNELTSLPRSIGQLQKLRMLDISYNKLQELPEEIGELSELCTLDASYSLLERLPVEMINLLSLKALYLESNPIVFPPEKIVKRGLYSTMHFLNEVKRNREASKVILQVYNLPQYLQPVFKQYIDCFHEIIASKSSTKIGFDTNFVARENDEIRDIDTTAYLQEFVSFIKQSYGSFKPESLQDGQNKLLAIQHENISLQLTKLNSILDSRKNDILDIQSELHRIDVILAKNKP